MIPDKDEVGGSSPPRPTTQTPRPAASWLSPPASGHAAVGALVSRERTPELDVAAMSMLQAMIIGSP